MKKIAVVAVVFAAISLRGDDIKLPQELPMYESLIEQKLASEVVAPKEEGKIRVTVAVGMFPRVLFQDEMEIPSDSTLSDAAAFWTKKNPKKSSLLGWAQGLLTIRRKWRQG